MPDEDKPNFSRRGFLRGAGQTAAGSLVLDNVQAIARETNQALKVPKTIGPDEVPVTLRVNAKKHQIQCEPRTTLAEALRTHIGLTGTKVVCDRGSCSACTIWLDKTPALACMTLAIDVGARHITTIEGLSANGSLHPVQAAFIEHDAMQCGFCTPGMVMSCAALLERNAHPNLDDVKQAVSGNLCRCGTYPKVFSATLAAAESQSRRAAAFPILGEERA